MLWKAVYISHSAILVDVLGQVYIILTKCQVYSSTVRVPINTRVQGGGSPGHCGMVDSGQTHYYIVCIW